MPLPMTRQQIRDELRARCGKSAQWDMKNRNEVRRQITQELVFRNKVFREYNNLFALSTRIGRRVAASFLPNPRKGITDPNRPTTRRNAAMRRAMTYMRRVDIEQCKTLRRRQALIGTMAMFLSNRENAVLLGVGCETRKRALTKLHKKWMKTENPAAYKAYRRASRLSHKRNNPAAWQAINARHKARKRNAPTFQNDGVAAFYKAKPKSIKCHWCGKLTPRRDLHADHIKPLCLGGANAAFNLCWSCSKCNCDKSGQHPNEWIKKGQLVLV